MAALLLTEKLNRILDIDEDAMTVTVQAGAVSAEVDDELAARHLGSRSSATTTTSPSAASPPSEGSAPASHRFGLFVDTVQRLEYVTWDGDAGHAAAATRTPPTSTGCSPVSAATA